MIRLPIIIFLLGWHNTLGQLSDAIQKYEARYIKKCERTCFKHLDIDELSCYRSKMEIKKLQINFLPIYQVKNSNEREDINRFFKNLKVLKKPEPMFFAFKDSKYFGRMVSTRLHNPWENRFEIYCNDEIDWSIHEQTIKEVDFIMKSEPDALLNIANYRFPLVLIKDDKFYFINFFNGAELKLISPDDWINDFKLRTGESWTVLSY